MLKLGPLLLPAQTPAFWLAAVAVFAFTLFRIWQRSNRKRLGMRLAAGVLAVFALCGLGLQPAWLGTSEPEEVVLLTPGMPAQHLQTALEALPRAARVFSLPEADTSLLNGRAHEAILDVGYLKRHHPALGRMHVLGHGLRAYDWSELDSLPISAQLAPPVLGIQSVSWQRDLALGEKLQVQGRVVGLPNENCRVQLFDPGGAADSLEISSQTGGQFAFLSAPRATGKFLYRLLLESARGDTLAHETLEVAVRAPRPLRILIAEATPRFETKYFKNWTSQRRHALALRTLISRDRYREEFINLSARNLRQITPALLRDFSAIIVDGRTLATLPPHDRQALRAAIATEGLGLLIIPDEVIFANENFPEKNFFTDFEFAPFAEFQPRLVRPRWPTLDTVQISAIPAAPGEIQRAWDIKPMITDDMERWLAAARRRGAGKIGLSLIRDSYRWILEGRREVYAAYWSYLLAELARDLNPQEQWNLRQAQPVLIDQPLDLTVHSFQSDPVAIVTDGTGQADSVFLAQDVNEPQRWHGTYWPASTGWHAIAASAGEASWFFVSAPRQWQTWQQAQKITATQQHAQRHAGSRNPDAATSRAHARPVPLAWFFLAFLLGAGSLWLEPKL